MQRNPRRDAGATKGISQPNMPFAFQSPVSSVGNAGYSLKYVSRRIILLLSIIDFDTCPLEFFLDFLRVHS
jgi:hypothetical protein